MENTLKLFLENKHFDDIPSLAMLAGDIKLIKLRAKKIANNLKNFIEKDKITVIKSISRMGSGSFPLQNIETYVVKLQLGSFTSKLEKLLRTNTPSVFVRLQDSSMIIDPRTLFPEEDEEIVDIINNFFG